MISRRHFMGLSIAGAVSATFPKPAKADLFGTDITVLLAQLEQQLQLVTNAISTVQNLVRSVQHLGNILEQSKAVLTHASKGDFLGVLESVKQISMGAQNMTANLQRFNYRGGQWKNLIIAKQRNGESLDAIDISRLSLEASQWNLQMVKDTGRMIGAVTDLTGSYNTMNQIVDMVNTSSATQGVVGQLERLQGIVGASASIGLHQDQVASTQLALNAQKMQLDAARREATRQRQEDLWRDVDKVETGRPVATEWDVDQRW